MVASANTESTNGDLLVKKTLQETKKFLRCYEYGFEYGQFGFYQTHW